MLYVDDQQTAARAKKIFTAVNDEVVQKRVDRYQAALASPRDHENGKRVFVKNCINCHKSGEDGHDVGPNLGTIVNKPDETVLLDILKPSDRIESDYRSYLIATNDGRTVAGVLQSETPTSVLLVKEKGETVSVLRRDIESMRALDVSMMPSNLHEEITPKQLADLIGWMRRTFSK